jgi:aminotransferase
MSKPLSALVEKLPDSGITEYFDPKALGEGTFSLGVGEPDFDTPAHIRLAAIKALENADTKYTDNKGVERLREQLSLYLEKFGVHYNPDKEILVTTGGSEGIDLAFRAVLNPGDEVLVIQPSYVSYLPCVELGGGVPVVVETSEKNGFRVKAEDLEAKLTPKTKMVIMPYPCNPTGVILEKEDLEEIADFIVKNDLYVLSDEVYAELTYGSTHVSIASMPGMKERTIVVNSFSKGFAMTGWRIGVAAAPAPIMKLMERIHQYTIMSVGTVNQAAVLDALENPDRDKEIGHMRDVYNERRKRIVDGLNRIGLPTVEPKGAFYAFPNITSTGLSSQEYCRRLQKEQKVAVVPGNAFGACGEGFVRISYACDTETIKTCLERMEAFQKSLHA